MERVVPPVGSGREIRSSGGSLLARVVDGQLEFKCRRSRALVRITLRDLVAVSQQEGDGVIWVAPFQGKERG